MICSKILNHSGIKQINHLLKRLLINEILLTDQFKILEDKASDSFYYRIINPFTQLVCSNTLIHSKTKELTLFNVILWIIHSINNSKTFRKHWFITTMRCMVVHNGVLWICLELFSIVGQINLCHCIYSKCKLLTINFFINFWLFKGNITLKNCCWNNSSFACVIHVWTILSKCNSFWMGNKNCLWLLCFQFCCP